MASKSILLCLIFGVIKHHILGVLAMTTLTVVIIRLLYLKLWHPLSRFNGPFLAAFTDGFWFYILLSGRAPWKNQEWHRNWGPIVRIAPNHLSFCAPGSTKEIYDYPSRVDKVSRSRLKKDPIFFTPEIDGSMNIINEIDDATHSRMHNMMIYAFSPRNLQTQSNEDVLVKWTNQFISEVRNASSEGRKIGFSIAPLFKELTFNITGEMSFGESFNAVQSQQLDPRSRWAHVIVQSTYWHDVQRAICVIPGLYTLVEWYKPDAWKKTLYRHAKYSTDHTNARIATPTSRKDIMYHMLKNRGKDSPETRATDFELQSHFNVIILAGTVTTATLLTAATYYLGCNPSVMSRLQKELRRRFSTLEQMTSEELTRCVYLNAVIKEGLRIYPPAGAAHLSRIVPEGGRTISGVFIPGGTRVSVHPWSIIRDPSNFHSPTSFIPERWIPDEPEAQLGDNLSASYPFSTGPRVCLGRHLAWLEMRMILAKLFWKYDLVWFNGHEIDWERDSMGYTLWQMPDLRVILRDVEGSVLGKG